MVPDLEQHLETTAGFEGTCGMSRINIALLAKFE